MQEESRGNYRGQNLTQVLQEANARIIRGDLADHVAIPTGLDRIDASINGGLRKSELLLLGGSPGVGKTIVSLQVARHMATIPNHYVLYVSYEHSEIHLFHRLLCLESISMGNGDVGRGVTLRDLHRLIEEGMTTKELNSSSALGFVELLRADPSTRSALDGMRDYANRLILLSASSRTFNLEQIRLATEELMLRADGNVILFVDYLQKVSAQPEKPANEEEKVTIIVEGLKDLALDLNIPVWSIVAASREGLRSKRLHLYHLRGSSALDYECDIAIIMNNKFGLVHKNVIDVAVDAGSYRKWVVFTIEKNRAGTAFQQLEFELVAQHFGFIPQGNFIRPGSLIGERSDGM